MNLAKEAYEAYANSTKRKSLVSGDPLPQWDLLSPEIQRAWSVSAAWIVGKLSGNHDWKIPMKDMATANRIRTETANLEPWAAKQRAGELVMELLTSLGCTETPAAFEGWIYCDTKD